MGIVINNGIVLIDHVNNLCRLGMARAVIGGLAFSAVISLVVVPFVYVPLDWLRSWTSTARHRAAGQRSVRPRA